eukprot:SAG22_NODE_1100_length_5563_cov_24.716874_1_plen_95_part_10
MHGAEQIEQELGRRGVRLCDSTQSWTSSDGRSGHYPPELLRDGTGLLGAGGDAHHNGGGVGGLRGAGIMGGGTAGSYRPNAHPRTAFDAAPVARP